MKIIETSLNLRIERGKCKEDYLISEDIAKRQLSFSDTDVYTNVEFIHHEFSLQKMIVLILL